jgi:hypothetical protein
MHIGKKLFGAIPQRAIRAELIARQEKKALRRAADLW